VPDLQVGQTSDFYLAFRPVKYLNSSGLQVGLLPDLRVGQFPDFKYSQISDFYLVSRKFKYLNSTAPRLARCLTCSSPPQVGHIY
jgi:hypothetical protein